jgi:hypothetical protein
LEFYFFPIALTDAAARRRAANSQLYREGHGDKGMELVTVIETHGVGVVSLDRSPLCGFYSFSVYEARGWRINRGKKTFNREH